MTLESDITECKALIASVKSDRVKKVLTAELVTMEREDKLIKQKEEEQKASKAATKTEPTKGKKIEFKGYSWEQTNKNIKIRATYPKGFESIQDCTHVFVGDEDNIVVKFPCNAGEATLRIELTEKPVKHNELTIRYKKGYLLLTVPKKYEGNWQDLKRKNLEGPKSTSAEEDPSKSLMTMMQNLYNDGDDEMKATIGKAMYDSRNKSPDQMM
eukprot:TRINITY_DN4570_c3_g2_i1.p1 TRINITY_DN4570_c3_g2~~TRINITY_DN4570_c3_g2_i1.p1  ORF type:complete len:213 (+),score=51.03 TRINITY_DN4570_c3_g2_i1:81-719(+)